MNPLSNQERLLNTLEAGRVLRYHAAPTVQPQTDSAHQWGVAVIADYLIQGLDPNETGVSPLHLLRACLYHDAAELYSGDVPFTAKREVPGLKAMLAEYEKRVHSTVVNSLPELTEQEHQVLKIADNLEGLLWCWKTEFPRSVVGDRWAAAFNRALEKFSGLHPTIINRASEIAHNPRLFG